MSIEFDCANCGRNYRVNESFAGRTVTCKDCATSLRVPGGQEAIGESVDDDFLYALDAAATDAGTAHELPPRSVVRDQVEAKSSKPRRRRTGLGRFGVAEYVFGGSLVLALVLLGLIFRHNPNFFGFYVFFSAICLGAAWSKAERADRWIVPATGAVAGYAVMMLFAAVATRNSAIMIDLLLLGLGLAVFLSSPGVLGFAILTALSFVQALYFSGALKLIDVVLMDQSIRQCHLLANVICMICLISGYLYHAMSDHGSQIRFDE